MAIVVVLQSYTQQPHHVGTNGVETATVAKVLDVCWHNGQHAPSQCAGEHTDITLLCAVVKEGFLACTSAH